jgi:outer membrane receptor protein involved in Fe transport
VRCQGSRKVLYYSPVSQNKYLIFPGLFIIFMPTLPKFLIMRKSLRLLAGWVAVFLLSNSVQAQQSTITGKIKSAEATQETISAVSVVVKGTSLGTFTNEKGAFKLTGNITYPAVLVISSVGYEMTEYTVTSPGASVDISLKPASKLGQDIVVSATRVATRILESPVSIERVSASAIQNAPVSNYYEAITNLKGVDMMASSLTFKTPTTRGFISSGNLRFNQLTDGMDNQAPGLNFSVGSVIGLSELDVDNMELLPGASSALYGPGGMNGTLLINSKSPFKYQGLSFHVKQGMMHVDNKYRNTSPYYNWSVRYAQKIGERAAFKITSEFVQAQDWLAGDERNFLRTGATGQLINGTRATDPNYDGINVYGDETTGDLRLALDGIAAQAPFLAPFINNIKAKGPINVSRTGYHERDIVDPNTVNFKIGGAFHYKITNDLEASVMGYFGTGNTVYTGLGRYSLVGLKMAQYKFELNAKNWFVRAYTTQENSGDSYNINVTTQLTNERIKPSRNDADPTKGWYAQYGQAFLGALLNGSNDFDAHTVARAFADQGRPAANSQQFKNLFNEVRGIPIKGLSGGGLFLDRTDLYHVEGQYNLSSFTKKYADVLIGGNFRRFVLNSQGTLFADSAGVIGINEFGGYVQASRKVIEPLTITASVRYDKNQNFEGRFTPRVTALYKVKENKNIRFSYQTAYRFPSTQNQWINLDAGSNVQLIGALPAFKEFYKFDSNPVYSLESVVAGAPKVASLPELKPESVTSFELGYKGLHFNNKLLIDLYGYYGNYQNFIVTRQVVQARNGNPSSLRDPRDATTAKIFSLNVNASETVSTYGYGIGLDYKLPRNFNMSANYSSDVLQDLPAGFIAFFNAPKHRMNLSLSNSGLFKKKLIGFNITYRWQDELFYESTFATGIVPAFHTVDAQISHKLPKIRSIVKLGANNLLNQYYIQGLGNPSIGGLYYVSFTYNVF